MSSAHPERPVSSVRPSPSASALRPALAETLSRPATALLLSAAVAIACVAAALLMQHVGGYEPCALCVEQRMAYLAAAVVSVGGMAAARSGRALRLSIAAALAAYGWGVFTAGRQVWLQAFPPANAGCVMPHSLADDLGLAAVLPQVFAAGGDCLDGTAKLLGLTLPQASLAALAMLASYLAWVLFAQRSRAGVRAAAG